MFSIAKILLPVDFSERAIQAARFALPLAERFNSEIILLYVLPPYREFGAIEMAGVMTDMLANRRSDAEQRIVGFLREELAPHRVRRLLLEGDPAWEIVDCAHREEAGLIMMPTHGYGPFRRMLLGSVVAKVLHDADCPVWTTTHAEALPSGKAALKRILCAIDSGPSEAGVLNWSAQLAAEFGAQLTLVHAMAELDPRTEGYYFSPEWRKFLVDSAEAEISTLQEKAGTRAEVVLTMGPGPEMICEEARKAEADLLVIGRGADAGILGRLTGRAYSIIRQSPCPVVSV
ncbi:MAG TPA: universal stress protein [Bryobacteraceae bacterium]|jgi:nucleotide-binding universal stress UspA family protein|nr:universal stress protein [Bryobacteraceae bacterium]